MTIYKKFHARDPHSPAFLFHLLIRILLLLAAGGATAAAAPIPIAVSILPQKHFVEKIAGERVNVMVMVRPGASPALYEPRPGQMIKLHSTAMYFAIGVPFEKTWLPRIVDLNPELPILHTEKGIQKMFMEKHKHREDPEQKKDFKQHMHDEKHKILDPHIWLDPKLVQIQARNILNGLKRVDPDHTQEYERNFASFIAETTRISQEIRDILAPIPVSGRTFMVFHPSWGYFARAYGLRQFPIESEGKEPGPAELARIIEQGKRLKVRTVFVQKQFSTKSAELIAHGMQAKVVLLDPLAENWDENLLHAARAIASALGDE